MMLSNFISKGVLLHVKILILVKNGEGGVKDREIGKGVMEKGGRSH